MNRICLLGALLTAIVAGCATQTPTSDTRLASEKVNDSAADHCVRNTGSHIQRPPDAVRCQWAGRSYSQEELQTTGDFSAADALRRLDPGIQR
ncbi:MAG: hypothetical protein WDO56_15615 [Gammaproteobacteria bacterium]